MSERRYGQDINGGLVIYDDILLSDERKLEVRKTIGSNIRDIRKLKGISQSELGLVFDMPQAYISQIENAHTGLSTSRLVEIARALNVHPKDLWEGTDSLK